MVETLGTQVLRLIQQMTERGASRAQLIEALETLGVMREEAEFLYAVAGLVLKLEDMQHWPLPRHPSRPPLN